MQIRRVGDFTLQWGESLAWDEEKERLYFVDCAAKKIHWLERVEPPLHSMDVDSTPTGLVLCEDGRIVVALDDGLQLVNAEAGSSELLTEYPESLGGRANDAAADLGGNLVTGTLNMAPGPGSYWSFSASHGWRELDDGIGNANGPLVLEEEDGQTLVFADTLASTIYAYDYDGESAEVSNRRVWAETNDLGGAPDGACGDSDSGVWSCVLGAGKIARYTTDGFDKAIDTGIPMTSDVAFGGPQLDQMFFVSMAFGMDPNEAAAINAGGLMVVEDSGFKGRPEPRFRLEGS